MPEYFTLAELRALPEMNDTTRYTDARCEAAAAYVVALIERFVGTSFVARTITETHDGGTAQVVLESPFVLSVTSVTEDGVAISDSILGTDGVLEHRPTGSYGDPTPWAAGRRNITVVYSSGYATSPPSDVKEAALQATRYRLLSVDGKSGISDRASSITNEFGNVNLFTAEAKDRPTGLPEVDAVLVGWRNTIDVFGFR